MEPIPATREAFAEMRRFGDIGFEQEVLEMGRAARDIVPSCIGLSLGHLDEGLTFTLVSSSDEVAALDAVQYLDNGPCVEAAHTGKTIEVTPSDLLDEHRWALYARAAAAAGVASSLTIPVEFSGEVIGTINLYASLPDAFSGHHEQLAAALGGSAEHASTNGDLAFDTRRSAERAPTVLADQMVIDITIGMLAHTQVIDMPTAGALLREAAARADISLVQAARAIQRMLGE